MDFAKDAGTLRTYFATSIHLIQKCFAEEPKDKKLKAKIAKALIQEFSGCDERQFPRKLAIFDVSLFREDLAFQRIVKRENTDQEFDHAFTLVREIVDAIGSDDMTFRDFCIMVLVKRVSGTLSCLRTSSDIGLFMEFVMTHLESGMSDPVFDQGIRIVEVQGDSCRLELIQSDDCERTIDPCEFFQVTLKSKDDCIESLNKEVLRLNREIERYKYELTRHGVTHDIIDMVFDPPLENFSLDDVLRNLEDIGLTPPQSPTW